MMELNNVLSWLKDIHVNIQNADAVKPKPEDTVQPALSKRPRETLKLLA